MAITIRDIARKCNVSPMTVSRVINNSGYIKDSTRQRVLDMVKRERYDPSVNIPHARQRHKMIGFVSPVLGDGPDPFLARGLSAAQAGLVGTDYDCVIYTEDHIADLATRGMSRNRLRLNCDGLVLFCPYKDWDTYLEAIKQWEIPAVLIRRPTDVTGITTIHDNDYKGIQLAAAHLASLGHRSIGFVSKRLQSYQRVRLTGYRDYVREHGLADDERLVFDYPPEQIKSGRVHDMKLRAWVRDVLRSPVRPTAFVCGDDTVAVWLIYFLQEQGVRVPQDVAVVGYNNDTSIDIVGKLLTTVNIPVKEMVQLAYRKVFEECDGPRIDRLDIEVANELVVRGSCGTDVSDRRQ